MNEKPAFVALVLAALSFLAFLALEHDGEEQTVAFFAYGANLDAATMRARAGGFLGAQPAVLEGRRLAFQAGSQSEYGVANLVADENSRVLGAVYLLTEEQAAALDLKSGVPRFYSKTSVLAVLPSGEKIASVAYVLAGSVRDAQPSAAYMRAAKSGMDRFWPGAARDALLDSAAPGTAQEGDANQP